MFEAPGQRHSPERKGRVKVFIANVMEVIRREQEAIAHLRDVERVRRARIVAGRWQGPAVWMMPGALPPPMDERGIIDASRLTSGELHLALRLNMLSYDLLLPEDQQRLAESRTDDDYEPMKGLVEKVADDYARYSDDTPNYA